MPSQQSTSFFNFKKVTRRRVAVVIQSPDESMEVSTKQLRESASSVSDMILRSRVWSSSCDVSCKVLDLVKQRKVMKA